jgi:hypothetical protein
MDQARALRDGADAERRMAILDQNVLRRSQNEVAGSFAFILSNACHFLTLRQF